MPRKQKPTDFYNPPSGKKIASTEQCHHDGSVFEGPTENIIYCERNSSKLCAEGAIGNLMNILNCSKNDMEQFWDIVTSPVHSILHAGESSVPKAVLKSGGKCDSIQKILWILPKKSSLALQVRTKLIAFKTCRKQLISKDDEIPSCHFGEKNTCLLSFFHLGGKTHCALNCGTY